MRVEDLILQIKAAQYSIMENTFKMPPQDLGDFKTAVGFYRGLTSVLSLIEDEKRKKDDD